jgi:H+/Na+-translocating ferredoxin:NAD+ oxidoreductase subunit D
VSEENITIQKKLIIETSPQIKSVQTTAKIMWTVVIALLPAGIWGVIVFGLKSLIVLLVTIAAAVLTEYILNRVFKRKTIFDGSAVLTGLLIGFNMPPSVPLFIPVIASIFAIAVVKWSFGGLGGNWMNPALAGRVFVFFSWTSGMTSWKTPSALSGMPDALSSATPLGLFKTGMIDYTGDTISTSDFLQSTGYTVSAFADKITEFFQETLGIVLKPLNIDLFIGNTSGCIGEVSAVLLLLGAAFLFYRKIITWHIPVAYIGSFALLTWIFGGIPYDFGFFSGEIWFNLFSGGLILGAFYMATDMVTSPITGKGMIYFGIGVGFLTFLLRFFGSLPEGVSLAIILMNIFVPLIDRYIKPKVFGKANKKGTVK